MGHDSVDLGRIVRKNVSDALAEDIGSGDLTARLIDADDVAGARIIARESLILAGQPWVDEVFRQLGDDVIVDWYVADGQSADKGDVLCKLVGNTRSLLSGERTALNFLQTLCATATATHAYVRAIDGTAARVLDTRKTIPGLRHAQKYAVRAGGGKNHRIGLFDAILIKENHILRAGGIKAALAMARAANPEVLVEVEVETLGELQEALESGARRILLDNFSTADLTRAVAMKAQFSDGTTELEASGNITLETIRAVAETGVDFISTGALTKNVAAVDLSMLLGTDKS